MRSRAAFALALALALAGCGGGEKLSGPAEVPEGYTTYRGEGVSFAYPAGWKVQPRRTGNGGAEVMIIPFEAGPTPTPAIQFRVEPGAGERFDSFVEQVRTVVDVSGGTTESDEPVDIAGAEEARRSRTVTPPKMGGAPVGIRSEGLEVRRESDILTFVAAAPQREGTGLDPAVVVSSFRIDGG